MANEIKAYSFGTRATPIAPVAGTYTLTFGGNTTSAIQWDAADTDVQTALEGLASIGAGNVAVASDFANGFTVEFQGDLADQDVGPLTSTSSLRQPAATVTVTETQAGEFGVSQQVFTVALSDSPTEGKFILSEGAIVFGDTAAIDENASAATVETAIDAVVGYSVSGAAGGTWTCTSDDQDAYSWTGAQDGANPLRKALGIEHETTQEGSGNTGAGAATQAAAAASGAGTSGFAGSGSATQATAVADGAGIVPYIGTGAAEQAAAGASGDGIVINPVEGTGAAEQAAASAAGTGYVPFEGTGAATQSLATADGAGYTRMDIEGSGSAAQAAAVASGTGGMLYHGTVTALQSAAAAAGRGKKRYGDSAFPAKRFQMRSA